MSSHMEIYAFAGQELIAWGSVASVASILKNEQNQTDKEITLLFDGSTGQQIDLDLSGSAEDVQNRYGTPSGGPPAKGSSPPRKGRGRLKLGVVGREVTLLPRHWEWLDTQRGGLRPRCGAWLTRSVRRELGKTESGRLRTVPSALCPRWLAICLASRRRPGLCMPGKRAGLSRKLQAGRRIFGIVPVVMRNRRSNKVQAHCNSE